MEVSTIVIVAGADTTNTCMRSSHFAASNQPTFTIDSHAIARTANIRCTLDEPGRDGGTVSPRTPHVEISEFGGVAAACANDENNTGREN